MFCVAIVSLLSALVLITALEIRIKDVNQDIDFVLQQTWGELLRKHHQCTYVSALTSNDMLHNMKHDVYYEKGYSSPLVSIYWPTGAVPEAPEVNGSLLTRDNPWPYHDENKIFFDHCAVYIVVIEKGEDLYDLLVHLSSIFYPKPARDYFFFYNLAEDLSPEELLLEHKLVKNFKFKTLISFQNGQEIKTACHFCNGGKPDIIKITNSSDLFKDYFRNLNKTFIRCINIYAETPEGLQKTREAGEVINIVNVNLELLAQGLNFDWVVLPSSSGEGGSVEQQMDDGTWVGFSGDVRYDAGDLGLATVMSADVHGIVDLSIPFYPTIVGFAVAKPKPIYTWKIIVFPFTMVMWVCIILSIFISGILFWLMLKFSQRLRMGDESELDSVSFLIAYLAVPIIAQTFKFNPTTDSSKSFVALWLFYALIVSVVYQSKLVAIMSVTRYEIIPETFPEVVDMKYRGGADAKHAVYMQFLLQHIEVEIMQTLRDSLEGFESNFDCLENALEHKLMCMTAVDYLTSEMMKFLDHNGHLKHNIYSKDGFLLFAGMVLKKNSPILEMLDDSIMRNSQSGLLFKALGDMDHTGFVKGLREMRERQVVPTGDGPIALSVNQLQGPFLILIFCYGLGFLLFLNEQIGRRKKKR